MYTIYRQYNVKPFVEPSPDEEYITLYIGRLSVGMLKKTEARELIKSLQKVIGIDIHQKAEA